MVDTTAPKGSSANALPQGEAGAPEITPAMIEAGVVAYYENSGEGWSNPGDAELCAMVRNVFSAMWSNLPMKAADDETTCSPLF